MTAEAIHCYTTYDKIKKEFSGSRKLEGSWSKLDQRICHTVEYAPFCRMKLQFCTCVALLTCRFAILESSTFVTNP